MFHIQKNLQAELLKDYVDESNIMMDDVCQLTKALSRDPSDMGLLENLSVVLGNVYEGAFLLEQDELLMEIDTLRELVLEIKKATSDKTSPLYEQLVLSVLTLKENIKNLTNSSADKINPEASFHKKVNLKSNFTLFREVVDQHVKTINETLPLLKNKPDIFAVANVLRAIKGIKGATSFIGHDKLNQAAGDIETRIEQYINNSHDGQVFSSLFDVIHVFIGEIQEFTESRNQSEKVLERNINSSGADNGSRQKFESHTKANMKVNIKKVDSLMNSIGEMITLNMKILNLKNEVVQDRQLSAYGKEINGLALLFEKLTEQFYNQLLTLRMMPIRSLFRQFRKVIETLASEQEKKIQVKIIGESTEIDRVVIESLKDPLVHLIRNAVDHGIDYPDERTRAGKGPVGHVWFKAFNDVNSVVIEIEDDGRGIDHNVIREKAVQKGLVSEGSAGLMSKQEILDYIFKPGFSTAEQVTKISGRGVGMDVVRTSIRKHGGTIRINTEKGKGTTFSIRLPLSLSMVDTLIVRAGTKLFAIPTDGIQRILKIRINQLKPIMNNNVMPYDGKILPFRHLCNVMEIDKTRDDNDDESKFHVAVINGFNHSMAIGFDDIIGKQKIAIKTIGNYLQNINEIAGACIQGDGSVVLVVNVRDIVRSARPT